MSAHEKRLLRFTAIDGLTRDDLPLAAEIWLEELRPQVWVTREILKLGTHFKRYMAEPDPDMLLMARIERICQTDRAQVMDALRLMQIYGTIEAYSSVDDRLRVGLHLGLLQRYRVLEIRHRMQQLARREVHFGIEDKWLPCSATAMLAAAD